MIFLLYNLNSNPVDNSREGVLTGSFLCDNIQ